MSKCKCTCGCDKWVPLNEGLPRRNVWVLVLNGEEHVPYLAYLGNCNDWFSNSDRQLHDVTHWMEIPEMSRRRNCGNVVCHPFPSPCGDKCCEKCRYWVANEDTVHRTCIALTAPGRRYVSSASHYCEKYEERCTCGHGFPYEYAHDKWISVEDKLPEESKFFLAYCGKRGRWKGIHWLFWNNELRYWTGFVGKSEKVYETTHWMEIPEAPDEKCTCPETREVRECGNCCHWKGDDYTSFRSCTSNHYDARILGVMETARSHSCGWWEAIEECKSGPFHRNRATLIFGCQHFDLCELPIEGINALAGWLNDLWSSHGTQ